MPLRVVVVALGGPAFEGQVTTRSAVQLARASAMYADQVLLISPWADIAGRLHGFKESSDTLKRLWETIATDPQARELLTGDPAMAQNVGCAVQPPAGHRCPGVRADRLGGTRRPVAAT
jgi:hypothetical protein